jgi:hypothetical protein
MRIMCDTPGDPIKGEIFNGGIKEWKDCYFDNADYWNIVDFCMKMGWQVTFIPDTEDVRNSTYAGD